MRDLVKLTEHAHRAQHTCVTAPFRQSDMHDGEVFCEAHRHFDGYLLRFANIADFIISSDGMRVDMTPAPQADSGTISHVYINHVLPHALSQQGLLVFHASCAAIRIGDARAALAFSAEAGMGKSTLAASFASAQHAFLCDDGLRVERCGKTYLAHPSHPSIRLWDDSHANLGLRQTPTAASVAFTPKSRLLADDSLTFCRDALPLRAVLALQQDGVTHTSIAPMSPGTAFQHLFAQSFLLDTADRIRVAAHFERISDFTRRIPCFTLDYPRRYDLLPKVRDDILAFAHSLDHTP